MAMLAPLVNADLPVQLHVLAVSFAILATPVQLLRRKRDRLHKVVGYAWVFGMAGTAISSFWIGHIGLIGPFSPIHLLSVYVLWGLYVAIRAAAQGRIGVHRATMRSISFWGLGVAGTMTFLPGRLMNITLFGEPSIGGYVTVMVAALLIWQFLGGHLMRRRSAPAE